MAFPSNPSIGDTFTLGGKTYRWNGTSWARVALSVSGLLSSAAILDNSISAAKLTPNVLTPYALDTDLTTANVVEVGNLYFTNARSYANVVNLLNAKANTSDLVTSNVIEGANLYFTNARTVAALTGGSGISIASNGMVTAFGAAVGNVSSVNGLEGAVVLSTANIVETGSLYFTNARVYSNVINIGYASNTYVNDRLLTKANVTDLTTSNISETGGRNFFTNTRAISALTGGSGIIIASNGRITANISAAAAVSSVNGLTGDVTLSTANIAESGNLYYSNTRVQNYLTNIIGNVIPSTDSIYNLGSFGKRWKDIFLSGNSIYLGDAVIQANGNAIIFPAGSTIANQTTDNIAEGSNIYFTNDRVYSNVVLLDYSANAYVNDRLLTKANVTDLNTNNVNEGTNLYFTNARTYSNVVLLDYSANAYVNDRLLTKANVTDLNTDNVTEVNNLYFTNARTYSNVILLDYSTNSYVNTRLDTKANVTDLNTDNVTEGTNLYFTNARTYSNVILLDYANTSYVTAAVAEVVGGAPAALDALYKIAEAIGNDNTFAFTVFSELALKANATDLTTANVSEVNNLYFTNSRSRLALTGGVGVNYTSSNGLISIGQDVGTSSSVEFKDLLVTGNVTFAGNATVINTTSLSITDNMIYLNESVPEQIANIFGDGANVTYYITGTHTAVVGSLIRVTGVDPSSFNTPYVSIIALTANSFTVNSNVIATYVSGGNAFIKASINPDLGFSGGYNDGTYHHAGLFRDATDGLWKFFENYDPEPDSNVYIDTSHPTFKLANLTATNFIGNVTGRITSLDNHTTSNLVEGSNLYFTNARVYANVNSIGLATNTYVNDRLGTKANVADLTSSNIIEGANLYFTNTRAIYSLTAGSGLSIAANGLITSTVSGGGSGTVTDVFGQTVSVSNAQLACAVITSGVLNTTNVIEGANLYFTNTRAIYSLTAGSGLIIAANGLVTSTISGTVTDVFGQTVSVSNAQLACAVITSGVLNTSNVAEGANLYFTNTRSVSSLTGGTGISIAANGLVISTISGTVTSVFGQTTTVSNAQLACATITSGVLNTGNVIEGANLYFTNTRAVGALTSGSGISIAANGLITSTASGGGGSGTVTDVFGQTVSVSNAQLACAVITSGVLNTDNVIEGASLYFTNTRSIYALTSGSGISIAANGLITSTAAGGGGSVTVSNDEATNDARFIVFEDVNTGTVSTISVSSSKLQFNPSTGTLTSNVFSGNGAPLTSLNAVNIAHGTLGVARGGTATGTTPTNGQLLIGNGTNYTLAGITGTTNQITVTNGSGSITLSTPQSINTGASVQFGSFGVGTAASGTTGEIRATNNITAYYSDRRLKKNIKRIENALDKISKINGVSFQSNEVAQRYGYTDNKVQIGVIAQEIEEVLPEVVVPAPFDIGKNDEGEYSISGEHYKTVQYDKLVPLLIEAIKELKEEFEAFKRKVL